MIDILFAGIGWTDIALTLNRIAVGAFFMLSGYHKLFNAERHRALAEELRSLAFMQWALTNGGCRQSSSPPASLSSSGFSHRWPRLVCFSSASSPSPRRDRSESKSSKPIDKADRIDDWLYLPEILYVFMLITVVSAGAGPYSLDALILPLLRKHGA